MPQNKTNYKKLLFLVLVVFAFCFLGANKTNASGNVYGWAWTENIGWISFNNLGLGTCPSGSDCIPAGGGSFNYGVNIETTGNLTGYAWSENIGWIKFDPAGPYPATTPNYNYSACVDLPSTGQVCDGNGNSTSSHMPVSGWARACSVFQTGCSGTLNSNRGGWDGWINLDNTISESNAIWVNNSVNPSPFHNWGWGSDDTLEEAVTGWVSFNCAEGSTTGGSICGTSNYKVVTIFSLIQPPAVGSMATSENDCLGGASSVTLSWNYLDTSGNNESEYKIEVSKDPNFAITADFSADATGLNNAPGAQNARTPLVKISPLPGEELSYNTTYYWRVKVYDNQTPTPADSGWVNGPAFTTAKHPWPYANFTATPTSALLIGDNVNVSFGSDSSTCYNNELKSYLCNTLTTASCSDNHCYSWWFDYVPEQTPDDHTIGNPTHPYTQAKSYITQLKICDELGCCLAQKTVIIKNPLNTPDWREISPF